MFSECFGLNLLYKCSRTLRVYRVNENNVHIVTCRSSTETEFMVC